MIIQRYNPQVGQLLSIIFILSQDCATCSCSSCLKFMIWVLREIILVGGKYLVIKASLHLFQESILLRGKEENQFFAESSKENENNFIFTTSLSTSFFLLHITQFYESVQMGRDILIRSTGKLIIHNKIQQSSINITRLRTSGGRSNRSANKIIVVGI